MDASLLSVKRDTRTDREHCDHLHWVIPTRRPTGVVVTLGAAGLVLDIANRYSLRHLFTFSRHGVRVEA